MGGLGRIQSESINEIYCSSKLLVLQGTMARGSAGAEKKQCETKYLRCMATSKYRLVVRDWVSVYLKCMQMLGLGRVVVDDVAVHGSVVAGASASISFSPFAQCQLQSEDALSTHTAHTWIPSTYMEACSHSEAIAIDIQIVHGPCRFLARIFHVAHCPATTPPSGRTMVAFHFSFVSALQTLRCISANILGRRKSVYVHVLALLGRWPLLRSVRTRPNSSALAFKYMYKCVFQENRSHTHSGFPLFLLYLMCRRRGWAVGTPYVEYDGVF